MIYCFTKTEGELLWYYFKTTSPFIIKHRGFSIKKGIIRKRLTKKVLDKIYYGYYGYSLDFCIRFRMNILEIKNSFLDSFEKIGFKLLYKI